MRCKAVPGCLCSTPRLAHPRLVSHFRPDGPPSPSCGLVATRHQQSSTVVPHRGSATHHVPPVRHRPGSRAAGSGSGGSGPFSPRHPLLPPTCPCCGCGCVAAGLCCRPAACPCPRPACPCPYPGPCPYPCPYPCHGPCPGPGAVPESGSCCAPWPRLEGSVLRGWRSTDLPWRAGRQALPGVRVVGGSGQARGTGLRPCHRGRRDRAAAASRTPPPTPYRCANLRGTANRWTRVRGRRGHAQVGSIFLRHSLPPEELLPAPPPPSAYAGTDRHPPPCGYGGDTHIGPSGTAWAVSAELPVHSHGCIAMCTHIHTAPSGLPAERGRNGWRTATAGCCSLQGCVLRLASTFDAGRVGALSRHLGPLLTASLLPPTWACRWWRWPQHGKAGDQRPLSQRACGRDSGQEEPQRKQRCHRLTTLTATRRINRTGADTHPQKSRRTNQPTFLPHHLAPHTKPGDPCSPRGGGPGAGAAWTKGQRHRRGRRRAGRARPCSGRGCRYPVLKALYK